MAHLAACVGSHSPSSYHLTCIVWVDEEASNQVNMHTATNTRVVSSNALRRRTEAYNGNPNNREAAHVLMAYVKRNPLAVCLATNFDIIALSRASELVGE